MVTLNSKVQIYFDMKGGGEIQCALAEGRITIFKPIYLLRGYFVGEQY